MLIVLAGLYLLPLIIAFVIMYIVCLKTRRWYFRAILPVATVAIGAVIALGRYRVWSSATVPPWTQLIFFPGVPVLCVLLGTFAAWRLWCRRWRPRVVRDKK